MAQEDPNRLAEWLLLFRKQAPIVRRHFDDWVEEVREEPRLIWETPAVRYAIYGLVAVALAWGALRVANSIAPQPPPDAQRQAATADFHVVCSNQRCGHHFLIHKKFGFRKFPLVCPKCKQESGHRARRCNSPTCRGRWVAPERVGGMLKCPRCGDGLAVSGRVD
ncbi:MAG: hypothetical protein ACYTFA_06830 [Planctomycetota bacterium]